MLGLMSDDIFELEVKLLNDSGRGLGVKNVPDGLRKVIAEESLLGTPSKELQKSFGVSASSVSAYKNGSTSTSSYHERDEKLNNANNEVRNRIARLTKRKLLSALDKMTDEKLAASKAIDLSSIAKNMSGIMTDMTPVVNNNVTNNKVLIYAPRMKDEEDFDVIDVRE